MSQVAVIILQEAVQVEAEESSRNESNSTTAGSILRAPEHVRGSLYFYFKTLFLLDFLWFAVVVIGGAVTCKSFYYVG